MKTNCLDISNYTGYIWPEDVRAWKAAGIELVIVGLQYPSAPYPAGLADRQLKVLTDEGMRVECYAESQSISAVWWRVMQYKPFIERIWVAAEEDHVDEAWLDAEFAFIDRLGLPQLAGVYTGMWWWQWQPFWDKYQDRPVWLADYDGNLTALAPWEFTTIWQHAGSSRFAGVDMVDLNEHYELYNSPGRVVEGESELTRQEVIDLIDAAIAACKSEILGGELRAAIDGNGHLLEAHIRSHSEPVIVVPVDPPPPIETSEAVGTHIGVIIASPFGDSTGFGGPAVVTQAEVDAYKEALLDMRADMAQHLDGKTITLDPVIHVVQPSLLEAYRDDAFGAALADMTLAGLPVGHENFVVMALIQGWPEVPPAGEDWILGALAWGEKSGAMVKDGDALKALMGQPNPFNRTRDEIIGMLRHEADHAQNGMYHPNPPGNNIEWEWYDRHAPYIPENKAKKLNSIWVA